MPTTEYSSDCQQFFDTLQGAVRILVIKLYRLELERPAGLPRLPCLDHEAMLHEDIEPHAAAYVIDGTDNLHEVVYIPGPRRLEIDTVSTMGEYSPESQEQLLTLLKQRFPGLKTKVAGASWLRGDRRVMKACRAQVRLRDVLLGDDLDRTRIAIDRLQTISSLMEKESRVASWGARTVMTPVLAVTGFLTYQIVGRFSPELGQDSVALLRYSIIGLLGSAFLYYGVKAVHLTGMANRVWKRSAEYGLILGERRRLLAHT